MKIWDFKKHVSSLIFSTVTLAATISIQAYNTPATSTSDMAQFPNVTVSSTGEAWTTDAGDKTNERHEKGYTVYTGVTSSLRSLKSGEHYYAGKVENGSINIGKWVCMWPNAKCIHDTVWESPIYKGFTCSNNDCFQAYNNGWYAYCADCGELVREGFIYAKESTVQKITSMPAKSYYVYLCPHCNGIENTFDIEHTCTKISNNFYKIRYEKNAPSDVTVYGRMIYTYHMYNNSDTYEGKPVSKYGYTDTALRVNAYSAKGYIFIGWNTKADGSGTSFTDGQEVLNLTDQEGGVVTLYAQWERVTSTLAVDGNGGAYAGDAVWTTVQDYGTDYVLDSTLVTPPQGYRVTFETNGGSSVESVMTTKSFLAWEVVETLNGVLKNSTYTFQGPMNGTDTVRAVYQNDSFTLPNATKPNESLVGWYTEPSLNEESFAGKPGDTFVVDKDTILYAKWAELTLYAEDNYTANDGKGAVDLEWTLQDGKEKYYEVFQSLDKSDWTKLLTSTALSNTATVSKSFAPSEQGTAYTIDYSGWYTISALAGRGADYGGYSGGKGGYVQGTFFLKAGDVLTFYPGYAAAGTMGGSNANGAGGTATAGGGGGAASYVEIIRDGVRSGLLVAGGGGGANSLNPGLDGGEASGSSTVFAINSAATASYGAGGGGYTAGTEGKAIFHTHTNCTYHTHSTANASCYRTVSHNHDRSTCSGYEREDYYCGGYNENTGELGFCPNCGVTHTSICICAGGGWEWTCSKTADYIFICPLTEGWQCGMTTSTIINSESSKGGSNWINTGYHTKSISMAAGKCTGNGSITLKSVMIGLHEDTILKDVTATDQAAPNAVETIRLSKNYAEDTITARIEAPQDNGTIYYHMVRSYSLNSTIGSLELTSNITANTLTSGVCGYYYVVDFNQDTTVTKADAYADLTGIRGIVPQKQEQYLHVAPVDKAGNLGPTTHVMLPEKLDTDEAYPEILTLATKQLVLQETEYTYKISEKSYYIKADGKTEHSIISEGFLSGAAAPDYQIDTLRLYVSGNGTLQWTDTTVPHGSIAADEEVYTNAELKTEISEGGLTLITPVSGQAVRSRQAVRLQVTQSFTVEADKPQLNVFPEASAVFGEDTYCSDRGLDQTHDLTLVPDGTAPTIIGLEELRNAGNLEMPEGTEKCFTVRAEDQQSGMRSLTVTIRNADDPTFSRTYEGVDEIEITVSSNDYLFKGDFTVEAEASDNVGNIQWDTGSLEDYILYAALDQEEYRAGEKPTLTVRTLGYADRVEVTFPYELAWRNPELDKTYTYQYPDVVKEEEYTFIIPLDTPADTYTLTVTAYKKDRVLTKELIFKVDGVIYEHPLRTSIIDNGM